MHAIGGASGVYRPSPAAAGAPAQRVVAEDIAPAAVYSNRQHCFYVQRTIT